MSASNGNDTKQVFAMLLATVMVYKTDFSRMTDEQRKKYVENLAEMTCDLAEQLDQQFTKRGWDK